MLNDSAPYLLDVTRLVWRRWVGRHPTCIDRVCLAYLDHFRANAQAVVQHRRIRRILDREASAVLFDLLASPRARFKLSFIAQTLRYGFRNSCEGRNRVYLNVGHTGLEDDGFRDWLDAADVRPVYFVHDLIPITHPQFCRSGEQTKHRTRMRTVLTTSAGVIANSGVTLGELSTFARQEGLANPPSVSALLGSDAVPAGSTSVRPERPTFVVVGTIEARKNHLMLLQLWTRLIERMGTTAPHLLIIGQRGWECEDVLDLLDSSERLKIAVTELNQCDDRSLAGHLSGARALLFPSIVEGYGLPLVEALRAGVPVIASDVPVFREIAGGIPDYLDPVDLPAWERTVLSYSEFDSMQREQQLRRLDSYRAPTWGDHFAAVDPWIDRL